MALRSGALHLSFLSSKLGQDPNKHVAGDCCQNPMCSVPVIPH